MPSAFAHAVSAIAIGKSFDQQKRSWKFWLLCIICSAIPDVDVLAFQFDIPYSHWAGHRGITHSISFAVLFGFLCGWILHGKSLFTTAGISVSCCFALCGFSHGILDMLTNGGEGVALFAPFDNTRYFFENRPIQVSPIHASRFFSERGITILKSELYYVGLPSIFVFLMVVLFRKVNGSQS